MVGHAKRQSTDRVQLSAWLPIVWLLVALTVLAAGGLRDARGEVTLRVCADPDNMPFSNREGEGFENKLAELLADGLERKLVYHWFEEDSGDVPNTTGENACDIVMGYAQGTGLIGDSNPYYNASYVLIMRADDAALDSVTSLADPRLKGKRIGLLARTPPVSILAMHSLLSNAQLFDTMAGKSQQQIAKDMVAEIEGEELDAGILWGPLGGYYAGKSVVPMTVVPLVKERAGPSTTYGITLGIRPDDPQFKHRVNKVLTENKDAITLILQAYGVPVLDQAGALEPADAGDTAPGP